MIRLIDILFEEDKPLDYVSKSRLPHTIWQTKEKQWGATNGWGVVRYYNDRESAREFATNTGKESPHPGRPEPKQRAEKRQVSQNDDRADSDN